MRIGHKALEPIWIQRKIMQTALGCDLWGGSIRRKYRPCTTVRSPRAACSIATGWFPYWGRRRARIAARTLEASGAIHSRFG